MTANCPWYARGWQDGRSAAFHDPAYRDVRQKRQYNDGYLAGQRNRLAEQECEA